MSSGASTAASGAGQERSAESGEATKAQLLATLLAPCLLDPTRNGPTARMGWAPADTEFGETVRFQLERVLEASAPLQQAVAAVTAPGAGESERRALEDALEEALVQQSGRRRCLWTLMEGAGGPSQQIDQAPAPPAGSASRWKDWARRVAAGSLLLGIAALALVVAQVPQADFQILVLKSFSIVVLASLPAWLFLRFIVFRAGTIWTEYVLNLHRLGVDDHQNLPEPPASSGYYRLWYEGGGSLLRGTPNVYRQKFETYYGKAAASLSSGAERALLSDRTLVPVFLTAAVFAAGWATVLWRDAIFTPRPAVLVDMLRFGFLGAYTFVLQMMIRRYFQSDLKASAYLSALVRVATVLILVAVLFWALPPLRAASTGWQFGLAFFIGFFPLVGMQLLHKTLTVQFRRWLPTLENPYPLSDLVGLNVWYEARLLEEGIEDMENLVTANLVDVLLHTRVPVGRLVDWIDQAHLYLALELPPSKQEVKALRSVRKAVTKDVASGDKPPGAIEEFKAATLDQRQKLRRLGIRTATDFESAFRRSEDLHRRSYSSAVLAVNDDEFLAKLRCVLNDPDQAGPNVAESILKVLCNAPTLIHIRHWRDMLLVEHDQQTHRVRAVTGLRPPETARAS